MAFAAEKQTVIRYLAGDTLSHIVVAARIGLWGALPESLSVLRGAIESCAQLAYVVSEKRYGTVIYEAQVLGRCRQLDFERVCGKLGNLGERLSRLHFQISGAAGHSTLTRLSLLEYKFQGEEYDRLGFAFRPENARLATHHCVLLASLLGECLKIAFLQDGLSFEWDAEFTKMQELLTLFPV
jgi:hypothetical protein